MVRANHKYNKAGYGIGYKAWGEKRLVGLNPDLVEQPMSLDAGQIRYPLDCLIMVPLRIRFELPTRCITRLISPSSLIENPRLQIHF